VKLSWRRRRDFKYSAKQRQFTALIRKPLIINGAGEVNRTLVTSIVVEKNVKWVSIASRGEKWWRVWFHLRGIINGFDLLAPRIGAVMEELQSRARIARTRESQQNVSIATQKHCYHSRMSGIYL